VAVEVFRNPILRRVELAFLAFNSVECGYRVLILIYAYGATGPVSVGVVAFAQLLPAALLPALTRTPEELTATNAFSA
jgi:hypothetical protein